MRLLLPFVDDSTLFFATALKRLLDPLPCSVTLAHVSGSGTLSERQLAAHLPDGPDQSLTPEDFADPARLGTQAIVTSRLIPPILTLLGVQPDASLGPGHPERPRVVAFQGGLDFTPERGYAHRRAADAVFLISRDQMKRYEQTRAAEGLPSQIIDHGHPAFLRPPGPPTPKGEALTFFAQAISPLTRAGRMHMVEVLAALARRTPSRPVRIKLRHLRDENRHHLHREKWDYTSLVEALPDRPPNLDLIAGTMEEALAETGLGLTCTSTAAADLVAAGVPTLVHLDYVEAYLDPLKDPMSKLFEGSGLIGDLETVLAENWQAPNEDWLATMFCTPDLGDRVLAAAKGA